jgi:lysophospholipase L1-like esterase
MNRALLFFSFAFFAVSSSFAAAPSSKSISVADPHLFLTPENWVYTNHRTQLTTNCPGAYFKIAFSGTSFGLVIDTSKNIGADELPKIGYQIDEGIIHYVTAPKAGFETEMDLAADLAPGPHQIKVSLEGLGHVDRWNIPQDALIIKSFLIDSNAALAAPVLLPKRLIVYGDSITEGANTFIAENNVENKQWSTTWDSFLAKDLHAEISVVAFQSQGFLHEGQGNVPQFRQAFSCIRRNVPRHFSNPDAVFVNLGTNGDNNETETLTVMARLRASYPQAAIYFVMPFGRTCDEITAAYRLRKKLDHKLFLIDLGDAGYGTLLMNSSDMIHPNVEGHQELEKMLLTALQRMKPSPKPKPIHR